MSFLDLRSMDRLRHHNLSFPWSWMTLIPLALPYIRPTPGTECHPMCETLVCIQIYCYRLKHLPPRMQPLNRTMPMLSSSILHSSDINIESIGSIQQRWRRWRHRRDSDANWRWQAKLGMPWPRIFQRVNHDPAVGLSLIYRHGKRP